MNFFKQFNFFLKKINLNNICTNTYCKQQWDSWLEYHTEYNEYNHKYPPRTYKNVPCSTYIYLTTTMIYVSPYMVLSSALSSIVIFRFFKKNPNLKFPVNSVNGSVV